jgi:hypothetical protein
MVVSEELQQQEKIFQYSALVETLVLAQQFMVLVVQVVTLI